MATRLTIRVTDDVIEAINVILSAEPGGTSQTYAISKAATEYAKVVAKRLVGEQVTPKVATPVVMSQADREAAAKAKWVKKPEPADEEEVLDENGYVIS